MKALLITTAAFEAGAGVALLCCPAVVVALLLGSGLETPAVTTIARLAGIALLAIGVACWLARRDVRTYAMKGLVGALLLYDLGAAVILGVAGTSSRPVGIILWPAVAVHAAMAVWCVASLVRGPAAEDKSSWSTDH